MHTGQARVSLTSPFNRSLAASLMSSFSHERHAALSIWQLQWRCFSSRLGFFHLFRLTKELSPSELSRFLLKFDGQCPVRGQQAARPLKSLLKIAAVHCVWMANRAAGFSHPEQDAHPFYSPRWSLQHIKKARPHNHLSTSDIIASTHCYYCWENEKGHHCHFHVLGVRWWHLGIGVGSGLCETITWSFSGISCLLMWIIPTTRDTANSVKQGL